MLLGKVLNRLADEAPMCVVVRVLMEASKGIFRCS